MTTQKRAMIGGEIGANGEFYEGGKFIATVDHAKGKPRKANRGPRRRNIAPYVWEMEPAEGMKAIYQELVGSAAICDFRTNTISPYEPGLAWAFRGSNRTREWLQALCDRYNSGERWVTVAEIVF